MFAPTQETKFASRFARSVSISEIPFTKEESRYTGTSQPKHGEECRLGNGLPHDSQTVSVGVLTHVDVPKVILLKGK